VLNTVYMQHAEGAAVVALALWLISLVMR
jgi:hypothetical protein